MFDRLIRGLALVLAAGTIAVAGPALAQQTIKLTIISGNAPAFTPIGAAQDTFAPKVDEILAKGGKYKISWVHAYSGQIVKPRGELEGVQTGLGELGVVPGAFFQDKMTLIQIGYNTPFVSSDVDVVSDGMNHLRTKFPEFARQMDRFNQVYLMISGVADDYGVYSKREITKFSDLKGMKVGAVGANQPWVTAAGSVPILVELATTYNALQTGIFEAIVLWQQAMAGFKFCEVAPYRFDVQFGAIANTALTVNKDAWNKLPADVRAAMTEAAPVWSAENNKRLKAGGQQGREFCEKTYKQKTNPLSAEDKKTWAFALPPMAKNWAKQQDAAGLSGTKMLTAWMDFMREKKQPIVRQWDKD
jgi:TRAP-type C4-dicarboxylate transport system substrate-binding protein